VPRKVGRPPAGEGGEKRTAMRHQVTARISVADYRLLRALSAVLHTSQADVVTRGLGALKATLPLATQRIVNALLKSA
jgi:hypothetical protein